MTMSEDIVSVEETIEEPPPLIHAPEPVTVSIEDYEAARETLVASGNHDPDDLAIVVAAVEAQTGNLPPIEPIEENNV